MFACAAAWSLTYHTEYGFVDELQSFDRSTDCHPSYRVLILTRVGFHSY